MSAAVTQGSALAALAATAAARVLTGSTASLSVFVMLFVSHRPPFQHAHLTPVFGYI